uniref:Secreted protein n=1 Tax=Pipistrellus kuhlii TaxID=59472 RepID=A0A7J7YX39_PIPKU|nr:hypothetical protein mPipKuh1_009878 [Pipistrellus kuhlii]
MCVEMAILFYFILFFPPLSPAHPRLHPRFSAWQLPGARTRDRAESVGERGASLGAWRRQERGVTLGSLSPGSRRLSRRSCDLWSLWVAPAWRAGRLPWRSGARLPSPAPTTAALHAADRLLFYY